MVVKHLISGNCDHESISKTSFCFQVIPRTSVASCRINRRVCVHRLASQRSLAARASLGWKSLGWKYFWIRPVIWFVVWKFGMGGHLGSLRDGRGLSAHVLLLASSLGGIWFSGPS